LELLGALDGRVGADIEPRVAKHPRGKHRDRGEARVALRAQDRVGRQRHFRRVELAVIEHAPEGLARPQRDEGEIDAFRLDPAVDQRLGAVVAPARDGELDPGHSLSPPPASLRAQRSNLTSLAHEYWAEIASSPFGLLAMTPFPTTRCSDCGCSGR